jgi:hypothetical protein
MIMDGLSGEGSNDGMKAELVKGSREEIYWMKLPDKASLQPILTTLSADVDHLQIRISALQAQF